MNSRLIIDSIKSGLICYKEKYANGKIRIVDHLIERFSRDLWNARGINVMENFTNAITCGRTNPEPLPLLRLYLPLAKIERLEIPPDFQLHVHARARDFLSLSLSLSFSV